MISRIRATRGSECNGLFCAMFCLQGRDHDRVLVNRTCEVVMSVASDFMSINAFSVLRCYERVKSANFVLHPFVKGCGIVTVVDAYPIVDSSRPFHHVRKRCVRLERRGHPQPVA